MFLSKDFEIKADADICRVKLIEYVVSVNVRLRKSQSEGRTQLSIILYTITKASPLSVWLIDQSTKGILNSIRQDERDRRRI